MTVRESPLAPKTLPEAASQVQGLWGNGSLSLQFATPAVLSSRQPWTSGSTWPSPELFLQDREPSPTRGDG